PAFRSPWGWVPGIAARSQGEEPTQCTPHHFWCTTAPVELTRAPTWGSAQAVSWYAWGSGRTLPFYRAWDCHLHSSSVRILMRGIPDPVAPCLVLVPRLDSEPVGGWIRPCLTFFVSQQ